MDVADAVRTAARQRATLRETAHRPWPLPRAPWVMAQTWDRLLFAHWPVDPARIRPLVPAGLALDVHDGGAWLGVTPFVLRGLRARLLPPAPVVSQFLELNVRTYVTAGDRPGILFFSLDASRLAAVGGARATYRLPYHHARMRARAAGERTEYAAERLHGRRARFRGGYAPAGERFTARPGSLEDFLCERYCLYAAAGGRLYRAEIHHPPWPLQPADAAIAENTMPPPELGALPGSPLLHYSARQDVLVWPLRRLGE